MRELIAKSVKNGNNDIFNRKRFLKYPKYLMYEQRVQNAPISNQDIIAHYKFENNANDAFGVHNGTPVNMTYATGKKGFCGSFNNSYVQVEPLLVTAISCWIKVPTANSFGPIVMDNSADAYVAIQGSHIVFGTGIGDSYGIEHNFNPSSWYHVVATFGYDISYQRIWINGVEQPLRQISLSPRSWFKPSVEFIGALPRGGHYLNGYIDELYLLSIYPTQTQINYFMSL